jgi:Uma2 family endonuclease
VVIAGTGLIPAEVGDLDSFCRWACSEDFPEHGKFSYLAGTIWVDLIMEKLYTHNQVKGEMTRSLSDLLRGLGWGRFVTDGMLLRNADADLSTEPDGVVLSFEAMRTGRVRRLEGEGADCLILDGTPEMVLEVVSDTSVRKDTVDLRELYWKAGIPEYWLIDARGDTVRFDILKHGPKGYTPTRRQAGGWLRSNVFDRSFRIVQEPDPLGDPLYTLEIRE